MEYNFRDIEGKWQNIWREQQSYKTEIDTKKPKYFVLDMFPYPSGAGLHVGHPLGYIASDIVARYKRLKGFNVLHPMGYDAFGLPAEQYAIQTGQHPKVTTEQNINRYRKQLDKIGFSFDWSREICTCEPNYYKWTQWIFIQLFHSWYNPNSDKAEPIENLIHLFETKGYPADTNESLTGNIEIDIPPFSASEWKSFGEKQQQEILLNFRIAYLNEAWVNWCAGLGTVLANDEVKDGVSERGGFPVERKRMPQWSLRITAYADRLIKDLDDLDWTDSIKEAQRNWIGKSEGTSIRFQLKQHAESVDVFTTRPDTIFGVSFVTLAPEHALVDQITTDDNRDAVNEYVTMAKNRTERERQADVKRISGQFTGAYVAHPFTGKDIPVWVGDYVLAGYGTGAVMAVPAHDSRDYAFAKYFNLEIPQVIEIPLDANHPGLEIESYDEKYGKIINSDFLNGLDVKVAIRKAIDAIEKNNCGKGRVNYRLRDAAFGRQRYWGEPIPIYYKNGIPYTIDESDLPLILPEIDKFQPTYDGLPPLARAIDWKYKGEYEFEYTTMPGWAGSSWYFLRYMDPHNDKEFVSKEAVDYWKNVDFYIGGAEHSTGHLLYVRFWTKFLYDLGFIPMNEPANKLINQGMIQGVSYFIVQKYFDDITAVREPHDVLNILKVYAFVSKDKTSIKVDNKDWTEVLNPRYIRIDINYVDVLNNRLYKHKLEELIQSNGLLSSNIDLNSDRIEWEKDEFTAKYYLELHSEVEKMSKSKWNVISPDLIVDEYGADTLRLYEMFLGPLEQSKPWSTLGISGVHNFLRKTWRLFHDKESNFQVSNENATPEELKVLHRTIKKMEEDLERFSFNTTISLFMICVNDLKDLNCNKREILEPFIILLSPYAPHIAEELWNQLGNKESITKAAFPKLNETYLVEDSFDYPISINGKVRFKMNLSLKLSKEDVEQSVMTSEEIKKHVQGSPKKIIVVPGRIVNVVI